MDNRDLKNKKTPLFEIYDDILKFYIAQGYLDNVAPVARFLFTGKDWKAKLINYLTPFVKFVKRHFEYKKKFQPHFKAENVGGKIWLFVNSLNNRNSLKFLLDELEDAILVGNGIQIESTDNYQLPLHRTVLYAWKFPKIWQFFRKKYKKQAFKYGDLIFKSVGLYEISYQYLSIYRPKCVVLSNDHSEKQRALLNAAKRLDIPVIYIQHASISDFMPPLDFDLSLLEGQAAWDKYKKLGKVNGKVQLIGMPKFDNYIQFRNHGTTINHIGICTNPFDNPNDIYQLIDAIQNQFPSVNISLRPHPGYKNNIKPIENVNLSTKVEHVFDFLRRQDLIIAGSSSIHLEAILLNITSLYFQFSTVNENTYDPYDYIKNGLLVDAIDISNLLNIIQGNIKNRKSVFQNVKYYNDVIGTKNEGKSGFLAGDCIKMFLENQNSQLQKIL